MKARQDSIRQEVNPAGVQGASLRPERAKRPVYLFFGVLICGCCGSGYTLVNKTRHNCAAARDKAASVCSNRATTLRDEVDARMLGGLKERLLHPDVVAAFVAEYRRARNEAQADASAGHAKAQRELAQIVKKIASLLQAVEDGMYHPSMKAKMDDLEAAKIRLQEQLAENPEPPALRLHTALTELYREKIADFEVALSDPAVKLQAIELLRSLISEIRMIPDASASGGHRIELVGKLAGILALQDADMTKPSRIARAESVTVVARAGFGLRRSVLNTRPRQPLAAVGPGCAS